MALARALAMSPGLLLLDEPLSALDARVRQHLRGELKQLQRRLKVTTIMVTHDQEEALAIADRIVVMNNGRIEQIGTPMDIYRQPAAAFVADFVGQMNFLPVEMLLRDAISALGRPCSTVCPARHPYSQATRRPFPSARKISRSGAWWPGRPTAVRANIEQMEFLGSFAAPSYACPAASICAPISRINAMRDLVVDDWARKCRWHCRPTASGLFHGFAGSAAA